MGGRVNTVIFSRSFFQFVLDIGCCLLFLFLIFSFYLYDNYYSLVVYYLFCWFFVDEVVHDNKHGNIMYLRLYKNF